MVDPLAGNHGEVESPVSEARPRLGGRNRVAMLTGSVIPGGCGVSDYTLRLRQTLEGEGIEARIVSHDSWGPGAIAALRRKLRGDERPDLVHIQYPMFGYGAGWALYLMPLCAGVPVVLTLHAFLPLSPLRRLSFLPFALSARRIIFTFDEERLAFTRLFPFSGDRTAVVPIGSNIPFRPSRPTPPSRTIVNFGLIRPNKGLEEFLRVARLSFRLGRPYRFQVMGATAPDYLEYARRLRAENADLPVEWLGDLSPDDVADRLSLAQAAYMPYPEGVSPRRGTLLAVLGNGVPTVTLDGPLRPRGLDGAVLYAANASEALTALDTVLASDDRARALRTAGRQYAQAFDWRMIARRHAAIYREVTTAQRSR
jgi:glycosyltransferase involved in cell wall biosynthesis